MEARERTQRKCQELFQQFVMEGLTPNQAAAKAIRVIKGNLYRGLKYAAAVFRR